jgi:hypothetical protein
MSGRTRRRFARISALFVLTVLVVVAGAGAALAAPPTISSFNPTSGPIGTSVQIGGSGFGGSSPATSVKFNGTAATFSVDSNVSITAIVPNGATDGPISVTDSEGTATSATSFDVTPSPVPTIASFNPTSGPVGTSVVITGTGFTGATAVTFNGTSATFTVNSNTQITATVPNGATTGAIAVTTPGGTATSSTNFTVTAGGLSITSFNPTSGPIGTSVVITGTEFTGVQSVRFNGVSATFTVNSNTQITATVPSGATTGPIEVRKQGVTATSAGVFTVTGPVRHERTITLDLRKHLVARGLVTVNDGFSDCASNVPVKIQRFRDGRWRTVDTTQTDPAGLYRERIPDRVGLYRAVAVRVEKNGGADVCARDRSPRERHTH